MESSSKNSPIVALWVYPWDLVDEGPTAVVARAQELGINELVIAVTYHAARVVLPHNRRRRVWYVEEGAAYFQPDARLAYGPLRPPISGLVSRRDLLQEAVTAVRAAGLRVAFSVIGLNNIAIGRANPNHTLKTAFGDNLIDYLCPSNEVVRQYLNTLLADLQQRYNPDAFYLEAVAYQGWDSSFHLEIANVPLTPLARFLFGLCFCPACLRQAKSQKLEIYPLHKWVRDTLTRIIEEDLKPAEAAEIWTNIAEQAGGLAGVWFDMRQSVVTELYRQITNEMGRNGPTLRLELFTEPANLWQQGINLQALTPWLKSAYLNCYAESPEAVLNRWHQYEVVTNSNWQQICAVRIGYGWLNSAAAVEASLKGLVQAGADGFYFYNYGLMTEKQLGWIQTAVAAAAQS